MKPICKRSHVLLLALLAIAPAACLHSSTGGARAADQPATPAQGAAVKPLDWLKAQKAPDFAPNSTLLPLGRWGWAMSFEVAKELADRWGYAVEFAGYVSEKVADEALANPNGRNGQCLTLVAGNSRKYKLGVLLDRQFPKDMPPEAYIRDADGNFIKVKGEGVTEEMWAEVVAYADEKGWKKGDYKNLNLPFESKFLAQPAEIRERMAQRVEDFVYKMLTEVLNTGDTAPLAVEAILAAGSYDLGAKVGRLEDPADWTDAKIVEKAKALDTDKGAKGNFDD